MRHLNLHAKLYFALVLQFYCSSLFANVCFGGIKEHINFDTIPAQLVEFQKFSSQFFSAISKNDTCFLKGHFENYIENSSFELYDHSLKKGKRIYFRKILNNLDLYFPKDGFFDLTNAEYSIAKHPNTITRYLISVTKEQGGVEITKTYHFILKKKVFYFLTMIVDAG
ncbi:MAG: hypothetical protein HZA79_04315 [Sphingobacteriales bacterium]|nr:hypothetical protein [Sphingobacteriales bacterium]